METVPITGEDLIERLGASFGEEDAEFLLRSLEECGAIADTGGDDRGVFRGLRRWYVIRKPDEISAMGPLVLLSTSVCGYLAGLHLWPYTGATAIVQLVFSWLRLRDEVAIISPDQARVLQVVLENRATGTTSAQIAEVLAIKLVLLDGEAPTNEGVQKILLQLSTVRLRGGEATALVRSEGELWFPSKV